ncbi:major antigen [Amphiprion ocellaris]|uniref:major antigen n=1 Tax=Amphiprion ocellaris TaxID=80972 RepID=UPI002410F1F0|nr:major antigen [Amphiprion ocellaris]
MAGGSYFVWILLLLTCVFYTLDSSHVHQDLRTLASQRGDSDVAHLPSQRPSSQACTDQFTSLNRQLQQTSLQKSQLGEEAFVLRGEVRQLKLQLATCSATASAITNSYQTQLQSKLKQQLEIFDNDAFLILKVMALTSEVNALQKKVTLAANSTEISELQRELEEKSAELNVKKQQIEENITNSTLILQIISLQNQIWDLQETQSRRAETGLPSDKRILALQEQLDRKISELRGSADVISAMLELISVRHKIRVLQRRISVHIEESRTNVADVQRQIRQMALLLKKKILQLSRDENNKELTREILMLQDELERLEQLMMNATKISNSQLREMRIILEEEKKRQIILQKQLEEEDYAQAQLFMNIISIMEDVREQQQTASTGQTKSLWGLLQAKEKDYAKAQTEITDLQKKLQLKSEECSGSKDKYEQVKTEYEQKIAELNRTGDSTAALILDVVKLHDEVKVLREEISNSEDKDVISELQRQLEKKQKDLDSKTADIERLTANPRMVLTIIELQDEIWDLQRKDVNGTTSGDVKKLQDRLAGLLGEIDDEDGSNTKLMLRIMTLQNQVKYLERLLSNLQMAQNKVTQLTNNLDINKKLLEKYVSELKEKNQTAAKLILSIADLHTQLRNLERDKQTEGQTTSTTISNLREQVKIKEEEHTRDQDVIRALQNKLNQTEEQCSDSEQKIKDLQNNLDAKMKELQSKSDTVTSLALQISTLTLELEELKRKLQNTESKSKVEELQKIIDEKTKELDQKTQELRKRSSQPQRLLEIISTQTEIEKLVNVAANDTDYNKIRAHQDHLNYLISGIQDEDNENTKLMFKFLAQQDEIARLKKQEESQIRAQADKIKDLEDELEDIRNQIKEKTRMLNSSDTRISHQSAQIMELHRKIKPLEDEISDLRETHAENLAELQQRLNLTSRQLQGSELQLQKADAKNFNLIMEVADLRAQLKTAQKQASKVAGKNRNDLEQQLKTQQRENTKLERTNKELTEDVKQLKKCCSDADTQCDDFQRQLQQSQEDEDRLHQQLNDKDAKLKHVEQELEERTKENNQLQQEHSDLQKKLQLKSEECSGSKDKYEQVKTEYEQKIAELNRTGDSTAALILDVVKLHDEVKVLREEISNSEDKDVISELQRQLEKKQKDLDSKTADIERLTANPRMVLTIIELQDEIWDLQRKDVNGTTSGDVKKLHDRLAGLLGEIDDEDGSNTKLMLRIMTLQNQVKYLERLLSNLQMAQNKVTQLTNNLDINKKLLEKYVSELKEKNQTAAKLILSIADLHTQLRNLERDKQTEGQTTSTTISNLREQVKIKEEEHTRDQDVIRALQNKLNQTEEQCSDSEQKIKDLQNNLDAKMKELQSKSDTVTSLALQISTLTLELEELKRKLQNTESKSKVEELQKIIDEKTKELDQKTQELRKRSSQPQRLLEIISTQTEIEKLVNVAANDTDYNKIRAHQDHLNYLISGIQDEDNENTKLMFKFLAQQDEIARLKKQEESQIRAQADKIKDLEDELEDIRNQIKEKTRMLNSSDTRISHQSAQIMELHRKIKPLEDEISDLRETHAENLAELQQRLNLTSRQLQGSELQLQKADAKNFNLIMEVADLRAQLKTAQKQASKVAGKNRNDLEQQLKTQQRENTKLERTNKELTEDVKQLKKCCSDADTQCDDFQRQLQQSQEDEDRLHQQLNDKDAKLKHVEQELEERTKENNQLQQEHSDLQKKLQLKSEECSGSKDKYEQVKTEYEQKIAELNRTGDSTAALILDVVKLHDEVKVLREEISNSEDKDVISELQRQLEKKQKDLDSKTADIERLTANPRMVLTIIELQDEIWDLQRKDVNGTTSGDVKKLHDRLAGLLGEIDDEDGSNTKLMLRIMTLQNQVKYLERLLSNLQMAQNKVTQLTNNLDINKKLLEKYVSELKEKNQTAAKLILSIADLHTQLRNLERDKQTEGQTTSTTISNLREQVKIKEEEHTRDQDVIRALQNKLNQTEEQCSDSEQKIKDLQNNLDAKMKELQSKSDTVTSLALQISTLTLELEELKRKLQNTESKSKVEELQKIIDEKTKELDQKTQELRKRSSQPQRLLEIISTQTEIEKLVNVAANDTDYNKIRAHQDHLNYLISGIQDEDNENTKLMFKFLAQQDEIARLKKQEESQIRAQADKIKDLEDELEDIRNQIKEKTRMLNSSDTRISHQSAQIMELHRKIKPLEDEISDLRETHAENLAELQQRLNLTSRQLQGSELQLQKADAKNFNLIMEVADLRAQLKTAQKQASKVAGKNRNDLEQQLKTQQRENTKLERTNKELTEDVKQLKKCCSDADTQCDHFQRQLQQSQENEDRLHQQLNDKDAKLKHVEQELEERTKENNQLQQEHSELGSQLKQAMDNAEYQQQQLDDKDARLRQLEQELDKQTKESARLLEDYNNLQNERNKLEDNIQDLQRKLTDVEDRTIYAKKMTFDPDTAHPRIVLSTDNTEMSTIDYVQNVPDHPGRFDVILAALGATGYSSGRHYWEVSVAGKTCFHIGMASESAPRKGSLRFNPTNGFWTIVLNKQGQYRALDRKPVTIVTQTQPITLGVLLDYKKGQISFYDAGARSHLYSFVGQSFTDKIYPFSNFCVETGENSNPIVLVSPGSVDWIK